MVKTVLPPSRLWLAFQPIAIRLTVYRPVLVTMPARMEGIPRRVCKKAVTNPAQLPAQHGGRNGQDRVSPGGQRDRDRRPKDKTTVGGHIGDVQDPEAQKQGHGHKAYKKPSSRAVCVIISKRMRSFHAAAPGSRPGGAGRGI